MKEEEYINLFNVNPYPEYINQPNQDLLIEIDSQGKYFFSRDDLLRSSHEDYTIEDLMEDYE